MASLLSPLHAQLTAALEPYFHAVGLPKLTDHWHVLAASFVFWHLVAYASTRLSPILAPKSYAQLPRIKRINWDIHVVSMVHCLSVLYMAFQVYGIPALQADKLFGYDSYAGNVYAYTCGYFLWDGLTSLRYVRHFGVSFLLHGIVCFTVFIFCFRPFLNYFGAVFLMFELSTPFLNIHWFMDKTGMTGTVWQAINGVILLSAFFVARILFGIWSSFEFFGEIYHARGQVQSHFVTVYSVANVGMNLLNFYWFRSMVTAVLRRFQKPASGKPASKLPPKQPLVSKAATTATARQEKTAGPMKRRA
ncbi:TLC domain-containing protein [Syncephalis pseudoplumigaleata]|uniref:TLC domain-containing protein n=1 Tax=Syncephalis pseudoplumigaleata TaxID=1712513 RepID=A0A4P9YUS1_9FUNG|nr:TLC domain-containing protein [Syncephalis pseudoplumigaleata]|eukprot:RKP23518.1 TLC domain-containing protein [Syncephalis pseudoplumigaleata]